MNRIFHLIALALAMALTPAAHARGATESIVAQITDIFKAEPATSVPTSGKVEIGFSPDRGALELVIKTINSAQKSIDLMAYSFTSADVTRALLKAAHRGVRIRMLVDYEHNFKGSNPKPMAALSALANAGAGIRTVSAYAIFHDKVQIVDKSHLQTGSFNYSQAAATRNSENVIVLWNAPEAARVYQGHFDHNWEIGTPFRGR